MRFRKLRIAWSVGWGLVCVLLIVLLVRSYWKLDGISGDRGSEYVYFDMLMGRAHYSRSTQAAALPPRPPIPWRSFHNAIVDTDLTPHMSDTAESTHVLGFGWNVWANGWEISVSLSSLALLSGALSIAPLLKNLGRRFSLRTMLIATTLVAVVLGLIAWAAKR